MGRGMTVSPNNIHKRGFASLSAERRLQIARKGGASVPADKRAFAQNRHLARSAGAKGGAARKARPE